MAVTDNNSAILQIQYFFREIERNYAIKHVLRSLLNQQNKSFLKLSFPKFVIEILQVENISTTVELSQFTCEVKVGTCT